MIVDRDIGKLVIDFSDQFLSLALRFVESQLCVPICTSAFGPPYLKRLPPIPPTTLQLDCATTDSDVFRRPCG